ncbi:MAG: hypothetical protein R3C58_01315 [Parvularculaceae bacterium]
MSKTVKLLLVAGAVYGLCAMAAGWYMGPTRDLLPKAGHAHLALIGWLALWVSAAVYAGAPKLAGTMLSRVHVWGFILGAGFLGFGHMGVGYFYPTALIPMLFGAGLVTLGLLAALFNILGAPADR